MALELLISAPVHAKRQYPEQQLQAATEQVLWFDLVERSLAGCLPVAINVAGLSTELSCWRDKLDPVNNRRRCGELGRLFLQSFYTRRQRRDGRFRHSHSDCCTAACDNSVCTDR